MRRKALVTGATGYIGSVLCKMLKEKDYYVVGHDRNNVPERLRYCNDFIITDLADIPHALFVKDLFFDVIFHLGAESLLGPSATDPLKYFDSNTAKTIPLIKECVAHGTNFVFASTAAVYAEVNPGTSNPISENYEKEPINNYGLSKWMTEQMLTKCVDAYQLKATSFRFFNVIGGYEDMGPRKETPHILSSLIRSTYDDVPFIINGTDWNTKDGTCVRDYVHVMDICRAMIFADKQMSATDYYTGANSYHIPFNLASGVGFSVAEIIEAYEKVAKTKVNTVYGQRRKGDPEYLVADPHKFIKAGFEYKHSSVLENMIESALWSFQKNVRGK